MPVIGHTLVGLATAIQYEPPADRHGRTPGPGVIALWVPAVVAVSYVSTWKSSCFPSREIVGANSSTGSDVTRSSALPAPVTSSFSRFFRFSSSCLTMLEIGLPDASTSTAPVEERLLEMGVRPRRCCCSSTLTYRWQAPATDATSADTISAGITTPYARRRFIRLNRE
jgi:hypothetical protein